MKIQHYPHASTLLMVGLGGIFMMYSIHFFLKKGKSLADVMKWVWVLFELAGRYLTLEHLPYGHEVRYLSNALLFVAVGLMTVENYRRNPSWLSE